MSKDLSGQDLTGANIFKLIPDLKTYNLSRTNLSGAKYNSKTM